MPAVVFMVKMPDLWTYDLKSPWNGETGEYELFYRTMSMFPTWNPWNEDGSPAAGWSNQDGNPYYWKDKLTRSTTNRKTSFNIGFALEILPQQLFPEWKQFYVLYRQSV